MGEHESAQGRPNQVNAAGKQIGLVGYIQLRRKPNVLSALQIREIANNRKRVVVTLEPEALLAKLEDFLAAGMPVSFNDSVDTDKVIIIINSL